MHYTIYYILLTFICQYEISKADIYEALTNTSRMLISEGELIKTVENYIHLKEKELQTLKRNLHKMKKIHNTVVKAGENILDNPLNTFVLIRRLVKNWSELKTVLAEDNMGKAMLANLTNMDIPLKFPDANDLQSITQVIYKLQETYTLDTSQLAKGNIHGMKSVFKELTAEDCYLIGVENCNNGNFNRTELWMREALDRYKPETFSTDMIQILEYLSYSIYKQGDLKTALVLTNKVLEKQPDHKNALKNKEYYVNEIYKKKYDHLEYIDSSKNITYENENAKPLPVKENVYRLCRGESRMDPEIAKKLTCYYQHGSNDFLLLAPVKAEVVHIHPTIMVYRDVIYDKEIEAFKELANPKFQRGQVYSNNGNKIESSARISDVSWLKDDESFYVKSVSKRIEEITGMNLATAEPYQVVHYGIYGHIESHFDYFIHGDEKLKGNRMATFLIYMNDVEAGGATVFPQFELSIKPEKGIATLWYNLYRNGSLDNRTLHAGCPVLVGQKWVTNKWIREWGQEFIKPCLLNKNE